MSDVDVHHLAAAYALDALEPHEREEFEAHYESCEVCRNDVVEFRTTMAHIAGAFATPPASSVKAKVMAEIATTRQLSPTVAPVVDLAARARRRTWTALGAAAAAVVLVVVGVVALTGRDDGETYAADLARVMEQPDAAMAHLDNMEGATGSFKIAWSESLGEAVLIGEDLPEAPDHMGYELWLITPDQSMAMYVLDPADGGSVHRVIDTPMAPSAWAITMEPEAGTPVATGEIMYMAEVAEQA